MILYVDSSAIVKRYVLEEGSAEVETAINQAEAVGTTTISRVEVLAALTKAVRMRVIPETEARAAVSAFNKSWRDLVRTRITERLVKHAASLAWDHGLRGYDAVQLASGAAWQQALGRHVTFGTFDRRLSKAARKVGLLILP
jgi:predicted nucleic acid-binding protein